MSQRRDRRGRYTRQALSPSPLPVRPSVQRAEAARGAGMRGLHRLFVERSLEVLDGEVARAGDDCLAEAIATIRAIRSRQAVSREAKASARMTLELYAGDSEPVAQSAAVLLGTFRRSDRRAGR